MPVVTGAPGRTVGWHLLTDAPGPVVVAVHGLEDSWESWQPLAELLAGRCRTYGLDMPWRTANDYRWRDAGSPAEWLAAALARAPEPVSVLLGHSYGANAILEHLAATAGDRQPAAAVLVAPFYRPPSLRPGDELYRRAFAGFRAVMDEGMRLRMGPRAAEVDPELLDGMTDKMLDRIGRPGYHALYEQFLDTTGLPLAAVTVPTLVTAGAADESLAGERAVALAAAMPAADVRLHPHYGHFCHLQQSADLAAEIAAFLDPHLREDTPMTPDPEPTPTTYTGRPRYEGANIRTWIGFKHFYSLGEEAVLQHFRDRGLGPEALYHRYGLGLEVVDSSIQLPATLGIDDEVRATVQPVAAKPGDGAAFTVKLAVDRDGAPVTVLTGKVRVALVAEKDAPGSDPAPPAVAAFAVPEVAALRSGGGTDLEVPAGGDLAAALTPAGSNSFLWSWRIPYFECHFSDRLQHSAYVRALEEVVDRFLADRGIAIGKLLDERGWIPVVSRARVRMLADAHMEEVLHTVFTVEEILRDVVYTARVETYVQRGDRLVQTAAGSIMHGYAISRGPAAGTLAELDGTARAALLGEGR